MDSVKENMNVFIFRQMRQHNFKSIIQTNVISNLNIALKDVETSNLIFGPGVASWKGKTTMKMPITVLSNYIRFPTQFIMFNNVFHSLKTMM
jgi:hypothetical protein